MTVDWQHFITVNISMYFNLGPHDMETTKCNYLFILPTHEEK